MYEKAQQPKEKESRTISDDVAQQKNKVRNTFEFVDNRPEIIAQKNFREISNSKSNAKQAVQLQLLASENHTRLQQSIQRKENNTGLPDNLKASMENLSGMSLDDVKVHRNSGKPAQMQAHAYAQGTDIHLGPGQEKHLPHEAWHVVQQKQGRVKPTVRLEGGVNVNDNMGLEKEADEMGAVAQQVSSAHTTSSIENNQYSRTERKSGDVVQREFLGPLGMELHTLNIEGLGLKDTWFEFLHKLLKTSDKKIFVTDGSPAYDPNKSVLYLKKSWFDDLAHYQKLVRSSAKDVGEFSDKLVSHIASIAHELTHAKDHLIDDKKVSGSVENVLDTELRAWNIEAVTAYQVNARVKNMDAEKQLLLDGFRSLQKNMLDKLTDHTDNHVIARTVRYIKRELNSESDLVVNGWAKVNDKWLWDKLNEAKQNVEKNAPLAK